MSRVGIVAGERLPKLPWVNQGLLIFLPNLANRLHEKQKVG